MAIETTKNIIDFFENTLDKSMTCKNMIDLRRKLKNFGPLEFLVISSLAYVIIMLIWTASTRSAVRSKSKRYKSLTIKQLLNLLIMK